LAIFEGPKFTGRVPVLVALIVWISEADDREKQKHYRAWELINSAEGRPATVVGVMLFGT
jgi:hypothetical protein